MNESNNIANEVTRIRIDALPMDKKVKYLEGAINEFLDAFFGILKNEKKGESGIHIHRRKRTGTQPQCRFILWRCRTAWLIS